MTNDREEVRLVFRPLRSAVPLAVRVRHLLKYALRTCNLRCVKIEDLPAEEPKQEEVNRI